ncbi:GMC oxidoreductase family protein Mala s 12.0101 (allergen Mala s 12.0101) [Durusdinium trenchii]|uniref:GMC oxidoreductase family protein Mala s 12.0101 (Allergen Mala s 12.0101) n=1 Tax=Durusdinium trenchii TaxID=1381693 RepID=A0ABP0RVR4_9DINO
MACARRFLRVVREEDPDYFQKNFDEAADVFHPPDHQVYAHVAVGIRCRIFRDVHVARSSSAQTFNLTDFYASSKWVAEQLSVPLRGSNFGHRYAKALYQAGEEVPNRHGNCQLSACFPHASSLPAAVTSDLNPAFFKRPIRIDVASATFNTSKETWIRRGAAALLHESRGPRPRPHRVKRINFEGSRTTSVLAENNFNEWVTIEARKGVILAGGAVFTPQILQVSGIGDPSLLSQLGVAEVVPNADVGRNFVDRAILNFGVWASQHKPLYVGYAMSSNTTSNITIEAEGWGKVASSFAIPSLGMVPPDQRTEALRGLMKPLLTGPLANIMNNMIQIVGLNHHTYSRGSVTAVSSDTKDAPDVTANYFQDDRDVRVRLLAMREKDGKGWKGSTVDESNPLDEEVCTIQRGGLINQQSA